MEFWQGKLCPVCGEAFKENDDIVCCPECGTAHHRSCWDKNGKCFFAEEHAKGNFDTFNPVESKPQHSEPTSGEKTITCPNCGFVNKSYFRVCMNCGADLSKDGENEYPSPPEYENSDGQRQTLEDDDLAKYCRNYAKPQLVNLEAAGNGNTVFSLPAFLLSFIWLLYRKVVNWGLAIALAVTMPLMVMTSIITVKCAPQINDFYMASYSTTEEYNTALFELCNDMVEENSATVNICLAIHWVLLLAAMFFCGFYGLRIYYKKASTDIKHIRAQIKDPQQADFYLAARGGHSLIVPLAAIMMLGILSSFISNACLLFF